MTAAKTVAAMPNPALDRILVGMSGGVDSSVCVQILRDQGFAVEGAVIRFSPAHDKAVEEAKKVAAQLGVPLRVLDCEDRFNE
ncbi:MAG: 7-cyano-7-deazaguanine synthase, partial [Pygmaiobacter massiliensis]